MLCGRGVRHPSSWAPEPRRKMRWVSAHLRRRELLVDSPGAARLKDIQEFHNEIRMETTGARL